MGVAESIFLLAVMYAWREISQGTDNQSFRLPMYAGQSTDEVSRKAGG